jgi:hypothetical protein
LTRFLSAKDDGDIIIQHIPARTLVLFLAALERWKAELIMPSAHQTMVDYLETITKPCNMMVEVFVNCVKFMACCIINLPFPTANTPTIDNTKLKNIIF